MELTTPHPPDPIAFVSANKRQLGHLTRVLRRTVGQVASAESLRAFDGDESYAVVAVHYDSLDPAERAELAAEIAGGLRKPPLLLLSEPSARLDFAKLFASHSLTNVLVLDETGADVADLLVTVQKLRRGEIFGLEKYFGWGVELQSMTIRRSAEKCEVLEVLGDYAARIGVPPRVRNALVSVADEFVTNALYNAPAGPDGRPLYASRPRSIPVELGPGEEIGIRFGCDGRRFGISTRDPFGSLSPRRMQDYLARCFRRGQDQMSEGSGGAGLGFYQIFDALSHFVVNIDPGHTTEMIGLLDVSGGYRRIVESGKSFNIFVKEGSR